MPGLLSYHRPPPGSTHVHVPAGGHGFVGYRSTPVCRPRIHYVYNPPIFYHTPVVVDSSPSLRGGTVSRSDDRLTGKCLIVGGSIVLCLAVIIFLLLDIAVGVLLMILAVAAIAGGCWILASAKNRGSSLHNDGGQGQNNTHDDGAKPSPDIPPPASAAYADPSSKLEGAEASADHAAKDDAKAMDGAG